MIAWEEDQKSRPSVTYRYFKGILKIVIFFDKTTFSQQGAICVVVAKVV